jgi:hypothetical protein
MDRATFYENWFSRIVWVGILVNLSFAIPALFFPEVLSSWLGLGALVPAIWMRNAGLLLLLLNGFYVLVARTPLEVPAFSRMTAAARIVAALFWFWQVVILGAPCVLLGFLFTDLTLGIVQGVLFERALAAWPESPRNLAGA